MTTATATQPAGWEQRFSQSAHRMTSSIIREILKMMSDPELISFSGGMPAPEVFPIAQFQEATQRVLEQDGRRALQYSVTEGYPPLREYLAAKMRQDGADVRAENILIVNGSQQALDFLGRLFLDPGDAVLTGNPTYLGALQTWSTYGARFATVPVDEDGMRTELVDGVLAGSECKFAYVLPNFHNPAGVTLSAPRRQVLLEAVARRGTPIIEDDPYGELRFEGEPLKPLVAYDPERVLYLSTFSKTLSPGIRLGWIAAPAPVLDKLVLVKQASDLHTSILIQMVAYDLVKQGVMEPLVQQIRALYRQRRDVMLAAMEERFPKGVSWTRPQGGLFLWVRLPEGLDSMRLFRKALEEKVAFVPGQVFFPNGGGANTMRLNFSVSTPEVIREGIRRLGKVLAEALG